MCYESIQPQCHHALTLPSLLRNLICKRLADGRRNKRGYVGISLHSQFLVVLFGLSFIICEFPLNQKQAPLQRERAEIDTGDLRYWSGRFCKRHKKIVAERS